MTWQIFLLLITKSLSSSWSRYDSDSCPNCVVFTTDTNFTSILSFESKVLIGAKNSIYEINFSEEISIQYPDRFEPAGRESCYQDLGQKEEDCQNYYKVILPLNKADLFICGTSAFRPVCGVRTISDLSYTAHSNDGLGICPANPRASTSYLKLKDSLYGFAGTEQASSSYYAISVVNLRYDSYKVEATTKSIDHWLNKPEFVYSFEYGDHVYFVMKEIAVEVSPEQIYSRVVRICSKNDRGGNVFFDEFFMTFVKARLYCFITRPGQSHYEFNEIGGAYFLDGFLYGIFSGPTSNIEAGSVLCKYSMEDIERVFNGKAKYYDRGSFKDEKVAYPFNCVEGRSQKNATKHQLMSSAITSSDPLLYSAIQMKKLVVRKVTISNETSIIAHAGVDGGKVIRIGFQEEESSAVRHRTLSLQHHSGPVKGLSVPEGDPTQVFLMSDNWVGYLPLQLPCHYHSTCQSCQTAFPYCGWCKSSGSSERSCTTAAECGSGSPDNSWLSPYQSCPPLATFKTKPSNKTVTLTESKPVVHVQFECESREHVTPSWSKLRSQIPSTAAITESGKVLVLKIESYTDAGSYICSLKGEAGNVHSSASLKVLVRPSFAKLSPSNVTVPKGEDVSLTCVSEGNPMPEVTWKLRNGAQLPDSARTDHITGELKLIRIVPADEGRYYCEIDNGVGTPKSSHDIVVSVTDGNPFGADSNATSIEFSEPFDYKKIIIIICCGLIFIFVAAGIIHCFVKKRKRKKASVPAMYPLTYQEQMYGDIPPHTPSSALTPQYMEQQMHFDWNQQHLLNQQLFSQQMLAAQIGPASAIGAAGVSYLLPQPGDMTSTPQEEPPPAYQAEIELHQPPASQTGMARRLPPPQQHFFTPVHNSPGYSMTTSVESQAGCSGSRGSENDYDVTENSRVPPLVPPVASAVRGTNTPPPAGARGPTPPPRSDIRPKPSGAESIASSAEEERLLRPTDTTPLLHEEDPSSSPPPTPPKPAPSSVGGVTASDDESVHEYERIGLLTNNPGVTSPCHHDDVTNNSCNPAVTSPCHQQPPAEQDNSSRGSSLLQT